MRTCEAVKELKGSVSGIHYGQVLVSMLGSLQTRDSNDENRQEYGDMAQARKASLEGMVRKRSVEGLKNAYEKMKGVVDLSSCDPFLDPELKKRLQTLIPEVVDAWLSDERLRLQELLCLERIVLKKALEKNDVAGKKSVSWKKSISWMKDCAGKKDTAGKPDSAVSEETEKLEQELVKKLNSVERVKLDEKLTKVANVLLVDEEAMEISTFFKNISSEVEGMGVEMYGEQNKSAKNIGRVSELLRLLLISDWLETEDKTEYFPDLNRTLTLPECIVRDPPPEWCEITKRKLSKFIRESNPVDLNRLNRWIIIYKKVLKKEGEGTLPTPCPESSGQTIAWPDHLVKRLKNRLLELRRDVIKRQKDLDEEFSQDTRLPSEIPIPLTSSRPENLNNSELVDQYKRFMMELKGRLITLGLGQSIFRGTGVEEFANSMLDYAVAEFERVFASSFKMGSDGPNVEKFSPEEKAAAKLLQGLIRKAAILVKCFNSSEALDSSVSAFTDLDPKECRLIEMVLNSVLFMTSGPQTKGNYRGSAEPLKGSVLIATRIKEFKDQVNKALSREERHHMLLGDEMLASNKSFAVCLSSGTSI